ncbi:unnamed protein product [Closterium sp. NIES-65]|nr:unnamed protein product [Closterium sp. NIES-65]
MAFRGSTAQLFVVLHLVLAFASLSTIQGVALIRGYADKLSTAERLQTKDKGEWAERFKEMGMQQPPKPQVQALYHSIEQRLRRPWAGRGGAGRPVATVGIHIRVGVDVVWPGDSGKPKELTAKQVDWLVARARIWIHCARCVEAYWFPSFVAVHWMLVTNSAKLKAAIKSRFPSKVITTDLIPRHSNSLTSGSAGSIGRGSSPLRLRKLARQRQEEQDRLFQELVTEWFLLASCDATGRSAGRDGTGYRVGRGAHGPGQCAACKGAERGLTGRDGVRLGWDRGAAG